MGLLDFEYAPNDWELDDLFSSDDVESEYYYDPDEGLDFDSGNSGATFWDWTEDDEDEEYTMEHFGLDAEDMEDLEDEEDDEKGIGALLAKVPGGLWSKLLDMGVGGLGEWMRQKKTPSKKVATPRGGGGGGRPRPVTAVTQASTVGTRTKG